MIKIYNRRSLLLDGSKVFFLDFLLRNVSHAEESTSQKQADGNDNNMQSHSLQFYTELNKILEGSKPLNDHTFRLELPEFAENGSIVPFKMKVDSPMIKTDYVKSLHLLSTSNPNAWVASFHLTPECGRAQVSGRMRLSKTQSVYGLAHLNTGVFYVMEQHVEVLIGGCGME